MSSRCFFHAVIALLLVSPLAGAEILDTGLKPADVEKRRYLDYARECIDLLMAYGTDRYGPVRSPMLMNILDVRTRDCPADPLALDEAFRVIRRGRRAPGGGNLYADQPLVRTLFALSRVTGDPRYAAFARHSAGYAMKHLVDEKGLFWWGWHRHYDAHRDEKAGHEGNHHEIHVQQAAWPELWEIDSAAVRREIEALWTWHVIDKHTGEVNRHADGLRGCDFAMSAGEILYAFAFLYEKTRQPVWLDRARLVADYHWAVRNPKTGLIPSRPNAGPNRFDGSHFDTSITGLYCHRLLAASNRTGEPLFGNRAVALLRAYATYGYDEKSRCFWGSLKLDGTPVPGPRIKGGYAQYEPRGPIDLWQPYAAGYEHPVTTAQTYALAAEKTRDPLLVTTAERWAEFIQARFPPRRCERNTWYDDYSVAWAPHGTYAAHYGGTISFFVHMHRITGDDRYLRFARQVANEAVSKLFYRGLFRGHSAKPYYESIDGVGYLLYALVQLDQAVCGGKDGVVSIENW